MPDISYLDQVFKKLQTFHPLSLAFRDRLTNVIEVEEFTKGHILLQAGRRARTIWFLNHGFAKEVSHENGSDRVSWFYFPEDFLVRYPLFFSELPAFRDIELITECVISKISYTDLIRLRNEFNETNLFIDIARGNCETERENHSAEIQLLSAKDRFDKFYLQHKSLFNIARHKDIANYLAIRSDGFRRYNI